MSATLNPEDTTILRDLGDHGTLRFKQTEKSRAYYLDPPEGKAVRMTSVTTVLSVLDKGGLVYWAEACGAAGALQAVQMGELDPQIHAPEEAIGVVRLLKLGMDAQKQKAAKRGLDVHDVLEVFCATGELPDPADVDPEQRPYLRGLTRALLVLDPEPISWEQVTCDPGLRVAGRYDLIAWIDGKRTMVDLKTARGGRAFAQAHLQIVGYDRCEQALGADPCDARLVLAVGPDGSFKADDCLATDHAWLSVVETFRVMQDIQRPLEALKRADKKAKG